MTTWPRGGEKILAGKLALVSSLDIQQLFTSFARVACPIFYIIRYRLSEHCTFLASLPAISAQRPQVATRVANLKAAHVVQAHRDSATRINF